MPTPPNDPVAAPAATTPAARIAALNDAFRRSLAGGRVMLSAGVAALSAPTRHVIVAAVQGFTDFDADNDPYGEHDFGALTAGGQRCCWKIDPYDRSLRARSPDPADPRVTVRVLTIMLAEES